jgi:crotonobetainyl-CoA:carnitine CoA-transferase CaiB-like acyl-CoA transferase
MICFIGEEVLAAQINKSDPPRRGNRSETAWPQGCYLCSGEDRWVAISVTGDSQWQALCDVGGFPADVRGLGVEARRSRCGEIDALIAGWTSTNDRDYLVAMLQERDVAAAPVSDARDLVENPHLAARAFWADISHIDAGRHLFPGLPIHLSRTPAAYRLPAPGLGEHNREVFGDLLGMDDEALGRLTELGVITNEPPA